MAEDKKLRSATKHIRSNYLFFGLYLIAKFDLKSRLKPGRKKEYLHAFDRMEKFFNKQQANISDFINDVKCSPVPFDLTKTYFFDKYKSHLGFKKSASVKPLPDYLSYKHRVEKDIEYVDQMLYINNATYTNISEIEDLLSDNIKDYKELTHNEIKRQYWKKFIKYFDALPNPLSDPGIFDFIQLLQSNYTLTKDPKIKKRLDEIGRKLLARHILWRIKDKYTYIEGLRWPNSVVYKDQQTFLSLAQDMDIGFEKATINHINNTLEEGYLSSDNEIDQETIWFKTFYYEYFPTYRWLFIFLMNRTNWTKYDLDIIQYWMVLINEALFKACNVFGNKQLKQTREYPENIKNYLNDQKGLRTPTSWSKIDDTTAIPFTPKLPF